MLNIEMEDSQSFQPLLQSFDLRGVASKILSGLVCNIVVLVGAGKFILISFLFGALIGIFWS
jgi:hypothetical protein